MQPTQRLSSRSILPSDQRLRLGALLFIGSLWVFFMATIVLYVIYAVTRQDDPQSDVPLPRSLLVSTACLLAISGMMHGATFAVRRERRKLAGWLLALSGIAAMFFMAVQFHAMRQMFHGPAFQGGPSKGVAPMVFVLAVLHALHVAGGVIALGVVSVRSLMGQYDHERHGPVDFAALYWHFLDFVWVCMLVAFWLTTGGF